MAVPTFVDRVTLHVSAGRGGNGVASVHREKFKPLGGPDGGNGGPGGSVILRVDPDVTTLVDYHHSPRRRAEHGGHGAGGHRNRAHGADLVLPVPAGTLVSDYPFTTLVPNLGVVTAGETTFTVADVPGLIEGAAEGRGLGHDFLRHIERCAALVHVIDTATIEPGRNPLDDLDVIERELARYGGLEDRPRLVALNKIDVPDGQDIADMVVEELRGRGLQVFEVSAASGAGLRELTFAMAEIVVASREVAPAAEPERIVLRPKAVDSSDDFEVVATDEGWRVRGTKPERWVRQTDFSNEEAVGFLADRLNRLGVEVRLAQMGAEEGDTVLIGADDNSVVFDFKPSVEAGAEMAGRRGGEQRLRGARPPPRP